MASVSLVLNLPPAVCTPGSNLCVSLRVQQGRAVGCQTEVWPTQLGVVLHNLLTCCEGSSTLAGNSGCSKACPTTVSCCRVQPTGTNVHGDVQQRSFSLHPFGCCSNEPDEGKASLLFICLGYVLSALAGPLMIFDRKHWWWQVYREASPDKASDKLDPLLADGWLDALVEDGLAFTADKVRSTYLVAAPDSERPSRSDT